MKNETKESTHHQKNFDNLWLRYFNRYLFENGFINEKLYMKMNERLLVKRKNRS